MSGLVGYNDIPVKITTGFNTANLKEFYFDNNGNLQLPLGGNVLDHLGNIIISEGFTTGDIRFSSNIVYPVNDSSPIILQTIGIDSTESNFIFGESGDLVLPNHGLVRQNTSFTKTKTTDITTALPTVIWSSENALISTVKLLIQLEQEQVGDPGPHTHSCEAIISARGATQTGTPSISVYGVNYTYTGSLVSFSVQRNVSSGIIEVVATLTDTTNPAYVSIHSVEQITRGL